MSAMHRLLCIIMAYVLASSCLVATEHRVIAFFCVVVLEV